MPHCNRNEGWVLHRVNQLTAIIPHYSEALHEPGKDSRPRSRTRSRAGCHRVRLTCSLFVPCVPDRGVVHANRAVTGATGFTGGPLAARLVRDGYDVTAFVRRSSNVHALESLGVEIRRVNITDAADVASNMQPFDRVFHLAASYREEHADREVFRQVNVEATRHLLEAAGEHPRWSLCPLFHCRGAGCNRSAACERGLPSPARRPLSGVQARRGTTGAGLFPQGAAGKIGFDAHRVLYLSRHLSPRLHPAEFMRRPEANLAVVSCRTSLRVAPTRRLLVRGEVEARCAQGSVEPA